MARISRHELKTDEFVSGMDAAYEYYLQHQKKIWIVAGVVLAMVLAGWGVWHWRTVRRQHAQAILAGGLQIYHAPLSTAASAAPGQTLYPNARARALAALPEFEAAEHYSGRSGRVAAYYAALAQLDAGQTAAGLAGLRKLQQSSHPNLAALARAALANYYVGQGQNAQAAAELRQIIANSAPAYPKAVALLQLARLESRTQPTQAIALYRQLMQTYPQGQIAQVAAQQIKKLQP